MRPRRETLRLLLFCAIVIAAAAVVVRPFAAKNESFDVARFARIQQRQPDFVFVGDSLLGYSVDQPTLESELHGRKAELLWHGGAASAAWYLYLKNFVAGAGVHPRRVFMFIHDDVLTDPQFRTTGKYAQSLQRLARGDEPLVRQLTEENRERRWWLARLIFALFPADKNRAHYQQKIDGWVRRAVAIHRRAARQLEREANDVFDLPNVRPDQPIVTTEERKPFDVAVERSFLPHILEIAHAGGYPISFVRPKKRPGPYANFDDTAAMQAYYGALRKYVEARGCDLVDLTHDPAITADMFSDAVHIGPWATRAFTKHLVEQLGERLR